MAIDFFGGKKDATALGSINITSHNQSGGITAHTVNVGLPPRRLDATSAAQLLSMLPAGKRLVVVAVMGDQEAFGLAGQILAFLKGKSLDVSGVDQATYSVPIVGVHLADREEAFEIIVGGRQ